MAALTFTQKGNIYESDWFQPNSPFQLDLKFAESKKNLVRLFSDNSANGTEPYALAGYMDCDKSLHVNIPVLKVIPDAGVYYKVACDLNPTSASFAKE